MARSLRRTAPWRMLARGLLATPVAAGLVLAGASVAGADQTVYFDGAGDAPHISLIGDSTLSGVRWYADYGDLERFNFVFSAESCRRTIEQSCISREGYRSDNVVAAMRALDGNLGEVLVVMSGYNDSASSIDEAIETVVDEARAQGVGRVVWLSLRAGIDVEYSDPQERSSLNTFRQYNERLVAAAAASGGYLQVADWATHSTGAGGWFEADGVHLTPRGVDAVTSFIAGIVERVLGGEDVSPAEVPWSVLAPGAEGSVVASVQEALLAAGIEVPGGVDGVYGNDTMVAVAEYQRRTAGLDMTGAVDEATARSLGVYGAPDVTAAAAAPTAAPSAVTATPSTVTSGSIAADAGEASVWRGAGGAWAIAGVVVAASVAVIVGRRRYVVARRAARRWARVHPATSPLRSVADMRRRGDLPPRPMPYDHQMEDAPPGEATPAAVPVALVTFRAHPGGRET